MKKTARGFFALGLGVLAFALVLASPATRAEDEDPQPKGPSSNSNLHYVDVKPFVLPVLGNDGPQQLITLIISLQVANDENAQKVRDYMPILNDAFLQSLYGALDQGTVRNGRLVDAFKVKNRLQSACDRVLGPGIVLNVLIQDIAQRQFK